MSEKITIRGGCHCGQVSFTANITKDEKTLLCNCSICSSCGYEHLFVPHPDFNLLTGKDNLREYRFGTKNAVHLFCDTCGIKSFYQPRSHPNAFSINVSCIENIDELDLTQEIFDGKNWEKAKSELKK